ncbi:MAG: long-chain-fatty-acid--CoA ligase [Acidimicrobiia bacterium]
MEVTPSRTPPDVHDRWREAGLRGPTTLAEVMAAGYARSASRKKVYRSADRPGTSTLGEIDDAGRRLASALWDRGLRPGDAVVVQLPNWFDNDVVIRAAVQLGLVLVPVVHTYGTAELDFILRETEARAVFMPDRFRGVDFNTRIEQLRGVPTIDLVVTAGDDVRDGAEHLAALVAAGTPEAPTPDLSADDVCAIVYTSGTTADPKGVMHTHATLLAERGTASAAAVPDDRPALQMLPAGHIAGVIATTFQFAGTSTIVAFDAFDSEAVVDAIEEFGLGFTSGAPVFLSRILDVVESGSRDLSCLRAFVVGAASVPAALVERADAVGIIAMRCYGSTEHPTVTISAPTDPLWIRAHTDGRCLPGNEVRIVDDGGRDLPLGTTGEIATRGPELFVGYRDATLDADAFLPEGWYRTGDLGHLDGEGLLTVTDRKKDIIIRGGENISAKEVEDVLLSHPAVAEAAVVGMPDSTMGERVCAFVVVRPGQTFSDTDARQLFDDADMARHKTPERIECVDTLPRTESGKVRKADLRARCPGGGP